MKIQFNDFLSYPPSTLELSFLVVTFPRLCREREFFSLPYVHTYLQNTQTCNTFFPHVIPFCLPNLSL